MCSPLVFAGIGLAQSALQIVSVNSSIKAQGKNLVTQVQNQKVENQYEHTQQAKAAVDEGFVADVDRKNAIAAARVRASSLGIRGTTVGELAAEEDQVGGFNVASAEGRSKNADTAYTVGRGQTLSNANAHRASLQASAPTPFESLLTLGAGALSGYMTGSQIDYDLSNLYKTA